MIATTRQLVEIGSLTYASDLYWNLPRGPSPGKSHRFFSPVREFAIRAMVTADGRVVDESVTIEHPGYWVSAPGDPLAKVQHVHEYRPSVVELALAFIDGRPLNGGLVQLVGYKAITRELDLGSGELIRVPLIYVGTASVSIDPIKVSTTDVGRALLNAYSSAVHQANGNYRLLQNLTADHIACVQRAIADKCRSERGITAISARVTDIDRLGTQLQAQRSGLQVMRYLMEHAGLTPPPTAVLDFDL